MTRLASVSAVFTLALLGAAPLPAQTPPQPAPAAPQAAPAQAEPPRYIAQVVARYPHDASAFTQGLIWHDGHLVESTGREGQSEIRRVRLADGRVVSRARIPAGEFGEGLALTGDTLVSLTWKSGVAHRWDVRTLKPLGTRRYAWEGWGLASAPEGLVFSDGSSTLRILDPDTLTEKRRVTVSVAGRVLDQLNELEMVDGTLFANVWHSRYIVGIDLADGRVTKVIDARGLAGEVASPDPEAVLNGIAWDPAGKRLFLTGKLWPTVFEVKLVPAAPNGE